MSKTEADVVIAGTGIVGCLIAEQALDAGLSVLMLEAGPRIDRGRIIENLRNLPPVTKFLNTDGAFPRKPWAPHPMPYTGNPDKDYLITSGPDAKAYRQTYVCYAGEALEPSCISQPVTRWSCQLTCSTALTTGLTSIHH